MAEYARLARASGARIIGGCCGTSPAHIAAMRKAIDAGVTRQRPTFEAVEASLGPIARPRPAEPAPAPAGGGAKARELWLMSLQRNCNQKAYCATEYLMKCYLY